MVVDHAVVGEHQPFVVEMDHGHHLFHLAHFLPLESALCPQPALLRESRPRPWTNWRATRQPWILSLRRGGGIACVVSPNRACQYGHQPESVPGLFLVGMKETNGAAEIDKSSADFQHFLLSAEAPLSRAQ